MAASPPVAAPARGPAEILARVARAARVGIAGTGCDFRGGSRLFPTFALRAGISTFDLSRYMGASLTMIDRHYGHLAATDASTRSACSTNSARNNVHGGRWWTRRGHRIPQLTRALLTELGAEQA